MAQVVIIGAGLTGISTAYHLEQKKFYDYALFEKEESIGGLCRTVIQDGFTFDYTGHLLHLSDSYARSLVENVVGLDHFHTVHRRAYIYSQNTYTHYPYQINLFGLPAQTIVECVQGFINRPKRSKISSFRAWVLANFGAGFGKYFFFPYQSKIFACDVDRLTASWTGRFVPPTSLEQILYGSLSAQGETSAGYNAQFFYPKQGGIVSWVQKFADRLYNPIKTNYCVQSIDIRHKRVTFTNGHVEPYEILINTMPLDVLLSLITERPSDSLKRAQAKLLCNRVINFNIGVKRADLSDKHWIYFPEEQYPFYRLGFPHNFAPATTPPGYSSLYGEISHIDKSPDWQAAVLNAGITHTKKLLNISDTDIATTAIINIPHAYVIYDRWRDRHVPQLLARLKERHIHSVGRYGAWKYASMQEAILDGKQTAEQILIIPARKIEATYTPSHEKYVEIPHEK